jgi:hypothetical protein
MSAAALVGLAVMIGSQAATLARIEPFWSWNTPIAWSGFLLFADGIVWRARGSSWMRSNRREFCLLAALSVPLWLVFEGFNLVIRNWYYVGLPENFALRMFGYAWAYATITPAIFEGAELMAVVRERRFRPRPPAPAHPPAPARPARPGSPTPSAVPVLLGAAMLISPFLVPPTIAPYMAAPVWLGFIFLLDPVNAALGAESILGDSRRGHTHRLINLSLSGLLCGVLWEFWNYWARAKWHYTVPIMEDLKVFEMPIPGYLGFPAFAIECFTMYVFVRHLLVVRWGVVRLKADTTTAEATAGKPTPGEATTAGPAALRPIAL